MIICSIVREASAIAATAPNRIHWLYLHIPDRALGVLLVVQESLNRETERSVLGSVQFR